MLHMFRGTADNEPQLVKYDISRLINLKVSALQLPTKVIGNV